MKKWTSTPRQVLQDSIRRKILLHFPIVDVTLVTNYNLDLYISEPAQKDETVVELKVSIHKLYIIFAIYESYNSNTRPKTHPLQI